MSAHLSQRTRRRRKRLGYKIVRSTTRLCQQVISKSQLISGGSKGSMAAHSSSVTNGFVVPQSVHGALTLRFCEAL